jgi:hypothetical protein
MLSEQERRELREIERFLAADPRFDQAMRCRRLRRERHHVSNWRIAIVVVAITATILCVALGNAAGALICAATTVAALGLTAALPIGRNDRNRP